MIRDWLRILSTTTYFILIKSHPKKYYLQSVITFCTYLFFFITCILVVYFVYLSSILPLATDLRKMKFKNIIKNRTATNGFLLTAYAYTVMPVVLAKDEQEPKLVRPKDLSIYPDESKEKKIEKEDNWQPTIALGSIQKVREEIVSLNQQWSKVKDRVYIFVQTGASHSESFVNDLRQENNSALRAGVVAGSGLAGLLIAARKGKFKKLVYATTGATAAFYAGYPKESEEATKIIKRYSVVSYHFINNVTKDLTGYELPPLPLPKAESQSDNSEDSSKPDLKELFFSLIDYVKEPLESLKQLVFNGKNGPDDKGK